MSLRQEIGTQAGPVIAWVKQCACAGASASGPRVIQVPVSPTVRWISRFQFKMVELACDVCDTPWGRGVATGEEPGT